MIILGIDPGLSNTGVAVLTAKQILHRDVLKPIGAKTPVLRIQSLVQQAAVLVQKFKVSAVAIESWSYQGHSVRTGPLMQQLCGALMMLGCSPTHPNVYYFDPLRWGEQLLGQSARRKADVARAVNLRMGTRISAAKGGHSSDAAGIALVCLDTLSVWAQKGPLPVSGTDLLGKRKYRILPRPARRTRSLPRR